MRDLDGKVALVGGASGGIGFACADRLAARGARVAMLARDPARLQDAAERIAKAHHAETLPVPCDLGAAADVERAQRAVAQRLGIPQVLVLNTGGPPPGRLEEHADVAWAAAFESLFMANVRLSRWALPTMRAARFGRIVTVASTVAREPTPNMVLSASLRTGWLAAAKALSREVAADCITVNAVLPGAVDTTRARSLAEATARREGVTLEDVLRRQLEGLPQRRMLAPDEVGEVVAFLCSPAGSGITGQALALDGGATRGLFG